VGATTPRACNSLIALSMIGRGLGFESIPAQDMALLSMSATASQASAAVGLAAHEAAYPERSSVVMEPRAMWRGDDPPHRSSRAPSPRSVSSKTFASTRYRKSQICRGKIRMADDVTVEAAALRSAMAAWRADVLAAVAYPELSAAAGVEDAATAAVLAAMAHWPDEPRNDGCSSRYRG
jgi:hypothetical protein